MDRRTLINGLATAAFVAVGVGAVALAQQDETVVANGPMSLEPTLDEERFAPEESELPVAEEDATTRSVLLQSRPPSGDENAVNGRDFSEIVLTQSTLSAPKFSEVSDDADAALQLPVLPSTTFEESPSHVAAPLALPGLDLTGESGAVSGGSDDSLVIDDGLFTLPTLRVADAGDGPPPVPSDLADPPTFELTPPVHESPITGPSGEWDNGTLVEDDSQADAAPTSPSLPLLSDAPPTLPPESDEPSYTTPVYSPTVFEGLEVSDDLLGQFGHRLSRFAATDDFDGGMPTAALLPTERAGWWETTITEPLRPSLQSLPVDVQTLVLRALQHSPDVLAFQLDPEIERKGIVEEQAAFDWTAFLEGTYDDVSDPVGNSLTTGGDDRFKDRILSGTGGLRQLNEIGGEFEVSQRFGYQDNNSDFFTPTQQGTSRLTLSYTQPLMTQRGKAYQQSRTVLAMLETGATEDDTASRIQDHLLAVTEAYWELYRSRALYIQRRNVLGEAERILATLEGRSGMDTVPRQLLRARSAVLLRRADITRSAMEIRNAESQLRLLVGDPQMTSGMPLELLPNERPVIDPMSIHVADAARTAMAHRPDIRRAVKKVRSTGVRVGVAENELLPRLDLVFNGYLSGLEGGGRIFRSFGDQFTEGRPSFATGLLF